MGEAGALTFGTRAELLEEAKRRIYQNTGTYTPHVYGEHEAGGEQPRVAGYLERQMEFCVGFYVVTDYWGSL
mgnify:CR=1 FL=1